MINRRTSIDLFSGAGGLTQGLKNAGFDCLYANEVEPQFANTFAVNHPEAKVESKDIRLVDAQAVRRSLGLEKGGLDLIAGGPPCQGFSINAPLRSISDHRNHLFVEYLRFVEEFLPAHVLIENVPGIVSFSSGTTLSAIFTSLEALGYHPAVKVLYAPDFGVPQMRWRTLIMASRDAAVSNTHFPTPTHNAPRRVNFTSNWGGESLLLPTNKEGIPFTNIGDAIGDLPALTSGESYPELGPYASPAMSKYQEDMRLGSSGVTNHQAPKLSDINLQRLQYIPEDGNWTNIPRDLLPKGMQRARITDHTKRYGRTSATGLSSTILTKCDPHWGAYFHYSQNRSYTVREAARLQSFPDTYVFTGTKADQFKQVGNAVPPMLGEAIGKALNNIEMSV